MSSINTNVTAMAAIRSLSMITNQMQNTQARVESGLRINKANDDPAVFSIAQTMRADLKGLTAVTDGLAFGKAALTVARDAATKVSNELATLKQTVTQGQQQGLDKATMNKQVENLLTNIRSFAETATFNNVNLLNNSSSNTGDRTLNVLRDITGSTIGVSNQSIISEAGALLNLDNLDVDAGGVRMFFADDLATAAEDFVRVRIDTGRTTTAADGTSLRVFDEYIFEFVEAGNAPSQETNIDTDTTAGVQVNTRVFAVVLGDGEGNDLTPAAEIGKMVAAMRAQGLGVRVNDDGSLTFNSAGMFEIEMAFDNGGQAVLTRAATAGEFEAQTDANGLALWTFDSGDATNMRVIGGTPDETDPTAVTQFSGGSSAIAIVDEAIRQINEKLAELGARLSQVEGQQEFTKQLTDSIREGLGALVDADLAEESARLTSLQTKQQLAIQSLSIANQQGQSLLGLFR
jgi:flagellin